MKNTQHYIQMTLYLSLLYIKYFFVQMCIFLKEACVLDMENCIYNSVSSAMCGKSLSYIEFFIFLASQLAT